MNESKKIILFDFDGVLAHMLEHSFTIHKSVNPNFTWEQFEKLSDGNFHEEYKKMTTHVQPENFYSQYGSHLETLGLEHKVADCVKILSKDFILYIVSSTSGACIKDFLFKEGALDCFKDILGHENHASKVIKTKSILEKEQVSGEQCIFITDTIGDIKEARACDVQSIGVTWGLNKKEKLEKENPFAVVDTPEELSIAIEKFFSIL